MMRNRSSEARDGWLRGLILVLGAAIASLAIGATAAAQAPPDSEFEKVTLNDTPGEPMDLAVLPDGRVLHTTRPGKLWLHDPETGLNTLAAEIDVYQHDEEGLQSVALDPNFDKTKRIYVYYSPPLDTPVDDPATAGKRAMRPSSGPRKTGEPFRGAIRLSTFKWQKDPGPDELGAADHGRAGRPRNLLPRRRRHRLRQRREPDPLDRQRH